MQSVSFALEIALIRRKAFTGFGSVHAFSQGNGKECLIGLTYLVFERLSGDRLGLR